MAKPTTGRGGGAPSSVLQQANCAACGQWADCLPRGAYAFLCPACDAGEEKEQAAGQEPEEQPARCGRCGISLLPNEHTRERGICHSCWADDMAADAAGQEPVPEELAPWLEAVTRQVP